MPRPGTHVAIPPTLAELAHAAVSAAGETPLYLVGGAVRDILRGEEAFPDVDLATEGDAARVARTLAVTLGPSARVTVHAAFGTSTVHAPGVRVDIARTRAERYPRPGSLPVVGPAGIDADLRRRDFTVNAMACRLGGDGLLLDPTGGRTDLESGRIRVLHDGSFHDDPTRILRAVRYASRLGFAIEPGTERLLRRALTRGDLGLLSGARLRTDLVALLAENGAADAVPLLRTLGVCHAIGEGIDCGREIPGILRRLEPLRERFAPRAPAWRCRLVGLARGMDAGETGALAHRLAMNRRDAGILRASAPPPRPDFGTPPAAVADAFGSRPVEAALVSAAEGNEAAALYLEHLRRVRLDIDGRVLREELGLAESPQVGAVLRELMRRKLNGELETRAAEIDAARELVSEAGS